jgi:hypothetical protein
LLEAGSEWQAISTYLVGVEVAVPHWLFAAVRRRSLCAQKAAFCSLSIAKDSSFSRVLLSKLLSKLEGCEQVNPAYLNALVDF